MGIVLKIKWNHKIYSLYLKEERGKVKNQKKRKIKTVDLNINIGTKTQTINDLNNLKGRDYIKKLYTIEQTKLL